MLRLRLLACRQHQRTRRQLQQQTRRLMLPLLQPQTALLPLPPPQQQQQQQQLLLAAGLRLRRRRRTRLLRCWALAQARLLQRLLPPLAATWPLLRLAQAWRRWQRPRRWVVGGQRGRMLCWLCLLSATIAHHTRSHSSHHTSVALVTRVARRSRAPQEPEYLVKWAGRSHIHNEWLPEGQLLGTARRKLLNFKKRHGDAPASFMEEAWTQPERAVARRPSPNSPGWEVLVKWRGQVGARACGSVCGRVRVGVCVCVLLGRGRGRRPGDAAARGARARAQRSSGSTRLADDRGWCVAARAPRTHTHTHTRAHTHTHRALRRARGRASNAPRSCSPST
jgi:hypothetical protein